MRTFWWLGLWLFVVLLMLCTGALIAGRALPPAEAVPELRQCDGMPCLLGIVPGKTGWEEAKKVVPNLSVKEMTLGITYSERAYGLTQM
ncbi:MAG TPA: hypothetical protein VMT34_10435, partial [Aggregatilineales bacterium]|nr:hypothetical protein [Aggregatilineales bacterium]